MVNQTAARQLGEPAAKTSTDQQSTGGKSAAASKTISPQKRPVNEQNNRASSGQTSADQTVSAATLPSFLGQAHPAVQADLAAAISLADFTSTVGQLSLRGRQKIVEQALLIVQENFVHLPLKKAMHGVDPVQKLRLIQHRLDQSNSKTMGSEFQFHRDMIDVFTSVRDLHTNYLLPEPFADKITFLPFDIEEYFADNEPHYIASHFVPGFTHEHFKKGVTITTWNGVPIQRAIEVSADQHGGSNASARHSQGLYGLTIRALRRSMPPDELWVAIGYTDLEGVERELRQPWLVASLTPSNGDVDANTVSLNATCLGTDLQANIIQQARKMLFAPAVIEKEVEKETARAAGTFLQGTLSSKPAELGEEIETQLEGIFRAKRVSTPDGDFGYIRIFSFNVNDPDGFINEFIRLIERLPQQGLIVDVRGNGGGHIYASEGLLQVLTPGEITPEPAQFLSSKLNARICKRHEINRVGIDLSPWVESLTNAVETGELYSQAAAITPYEYANGRGQKYHGPVVLITDARCYSATDIFAAGFQDHKIGHILGVDGNTGAGGANVWEHGLLSELLKVPAPADEETPYETLPKGAGIRVAVRRTLRVGELAGTPVEDLGVVPDSRHALTKEDLLNGNKDLINAAGKILKRMPVRELSASVSRTAKGLSVTAKTAGFTRLDVYVDNRPMQSMNVSDDTHPFEVELSGQASELKLMGYLDDDCVAVRRIAI
ncbi:MAG: S41 family peptidase [Cyanobacteria bacterium P01_F01_bin.3]